jgi:solute carrier family 45 protein 1/2/4
MVLIAIVDVSWAITQWVPYSIICEETSTLDECQSRHEEKPALGAVLGLHNTCIAAPQILAALSCSGIFKVLEMLEVEDSFGWVLRIAGISGLAAARVGWDLI